MAATYHATLEFLTFTKLGDPSNTLVRVIESQLYIFQIDIEKVYFAKIINYILVAQNLGLNLYFNFYESRKKLLFTYLNDKINYKKKLSNLEYDEN